MLFLRARYFEFRPTDLLPIFQDVSPIQNKPHFEHACIPGLAFDKYLDQQVQFLDTHRTEILTIHIHWDNIFGECRKPTAPEIEGFMSVACGKATNTLTWGGRDCFSQPIDALRSAGKRLILVIDVPKYDTGDSVAVISA